jgi:Icc protein
MHKRLQVGENHIGGERMANMILRMINGKRYCLYLSFWIVILLPVYGAAESATLYEISRQQLQSRLSVPENEPFTFVVMGDSRNNDDVFIKCLNAAARYHPLFILHTGDAVSTGSEAQFHQFLSIIRQTIPQMPVFVAIGNHELTNKDKTDKGKTLFRQLIGPLDFTLDIPEINVRLIALDSSCYSLTAQQIDYVKGQMTPELVRKFVFLHIPPKTRKWIDDHTFTEGADAFLRVIADGNPSGVFYGHYHLYDEDTLSGIRHIITGGAGAPLIRTYFGDPSHHFVVVRLEGGKISTEKVVVSDSEGR